MAERTELSFSDLSEMMREDAIKHIRSFGLDEAKTQQLIAAYNKTCAVIAQSMRDDFMLEILVPAGSA